MSDSCATCKFYKPTDAAVGICRVKHPEVVVSPVIVLDAQQRPTTYAIQGAWPPADADDWCGEFSAAP